MSYKIGIVGDASSYIQRLVKFLEGSHSDSIEAVCVGVGLEGVDFKSEKYDAVLISDDLKIDDKKIPSGIKKVYLAAKPSSAKQPQILKYQRLEEIYKQIIEICDAKAVEDSQQPSEACGEEKHFQCRFDGLEFSEKRIRENVYSVLDYSDGGLGEPDDLETGMLENNHIQGIAGFSKKEGKLYYDVTGKQPLTYFVAQNNSRDGRDKLVRIFSNIFNAMSGLEEYMLDWQKLVMRPDEIFVNEDTLDVALLYYPFDMAENNERGIYEQLQEIISVCERLMEAIDEAQDDEGTEVFDELQEAAKDSSRAKKQTVDFEEVKKVAYLIRKRTKEKIMINRGIFKLGKDENYVDYCIKDNPTVSRNHADIVKRSDGFYAVDKGSRNHTFVNGKKLEEQQYVKLEKGDLLQVADEVFEFNIK